MASTTALVMVNRLLRRHGFEDYTAFTAPETLLALDLVNQAIRDLLAQRDYPWNIRSDGALTLFGPLSDTDGCAISASTPTQAFVTAGNFSSTLTDYTGGTNAGTVVARLLPTGASDFMSTALVMSSVATVLTSLGITLNGAFPGATFSNQAYEVFFSEYLLPDSVAKVLSIRHQNDPIRLLEVDPHRSFDEMMPRPHDSRGLPEVVGVGGMATATYNDDSVDAGTVGLRLMVWPVPDDRYLLNYTYKQRVDELTTTTSTLTAPSEFVDDVIDRAEALSNMTQRFNAPDLAQIQFRNAGLTAERKWSNSVLDPARRHGMKPHDSGVSRSRQTYRDVGEL